MVASGEGSGPAGSGPVVAVLDEEELPQPAVIDATTSSTTSPTRRTGAW